MNPARPPAQDTDAIALWRLLQATADCLLAVLETSNEQISGLPHLRHSSHWKPYPRQEEEHSDLTLGFLVESL